MMASAVAWTIHSAYNLAHSPHVSTGRGNSKQLHYVLQKGKERSTKRKSSGVTTAIPYLGWGKKYRKKTHTKNSTA